MRIKFDSRIVGLLRESEYENSHTCEKCLKETTHVQSIIVGILWEASEGKWDDARYSIEYRLKPAIEKLEKCIDVERGELLYAHSTIDKMIEDIRKENLDMLMSESQTFIALLPHDVCYFLRGIWPYRPELRTRTKWRLKYE